MVDLVFWIRCMRSGCTCCHLVCCEGFTVHDRYNAQLKSEMINGNRSDQVTFVWTWRRQKQRFRDIWKCLKIYQNATSSLTPLPPKYIHIYSIAVVGTNFLLMITMCDARSHTCKSHDFIPRHDMIRLKFTIRNVYFQSPLSHKFQCLASPWLQTYQVNS